MGCGGNHHAYIFQVLSGDNSPHNLSWNVVLPLFSHFPAYREYLQLPLVFPSTIVLILQIRDSAMSVSTVQPRSGEAMISGTHWAPYEVWRYQNSISHLINRTPALTGGPRWHFRLFWIHANPDSVSQNPWKVRMCLLPQCTASLVNSQRSLERRMGGS